MSTISSNVLQLPKIVTPSYTHSKYFYSWPLNQSCCTPDIISGRASARQNQDLSPWGPAYDVPVWVLQGSPCITSSTYTFHVFDDSDDVGLFGAETD